MTPAPTTSRRQSFAARAVLAVGLMLGFYALAGGLAFLMVWICYWQIAHLHRVNLKIVLVCAATAYALLKGCLFLTDRFQPPGPEIEEDAEPELFALIRSIAGKMGARMPEAVYAIPDVNAFVAEVGGWMGTVGTRRVMGIGMGLLHTDSIGQLKATIAHEFGHFQGGDTRLGGFIYRTRASIGRVIGELGEGSWLSKPFEWYGNLFLRLTHAIVRNQELAADEFSVSIAGLQAHVEGLRSEATGAYFFNGFVRGELPPLLEEGCVPRNLYDGFRAYLVNMGEAGATGDLAKFLDEERTDPYDTHPALPERIAYARGLPDAGIPDEPARGHTLLRNATHIEEEVTRRMLEPAVEGMKDPVRPIEWDAVPQAIYAVRMARVAETAGRAAGTGGAPALDRLFDALVAPEREAYVRKAHPDLFDPQGGLASPAGVAGEGEDDDGDDEQPDASPKNRLEEAIGSVLEYETGATIGMVLVKDYGWRWDTAPGRPLVVRGPGELTLDPFAAAREVVQDPARVPALRSRLAELGIAPREPAAR